jgi:hypothetical protein
MPAMTEGLGQVLGSLNCSEVQGPHVSLEAAKNKLGSLDRQGPGGSPVDLGLPTMRDDAYGETPRAGSVWPVQGVGDQRSDTAEAPTASMARR